LEEVILKLGGEGETLTLMSNRDGDGLRQYHIRINSAALEDLIDEEGSAQNSDRTTSKVSSWKEAALLLEGYPYWRKLFVLDIHPEFVSPVESLISNKLNKEEQERWKLRLSRLV
jgi:hypothetical protein